MLEDHCPTCGSYRPLVQHTNGLQKRRYPRGEFLCPHDLAVWHLQLENLLRNFDLTTNQTIKKALQLEIEAIILENCLVDDLEVAA